MKETDANATFKLVLHFLIFIKPFCICGGNTKFFWLNDIFWILNNLEQIKKVINELLQGKTLPN